MVDGDAGDVSNRSFQCAKHPPPARPSGPPPPAWDSIVMPEKTGIQDMLKTLDSSDFEGSACHHKTSYNSRPDPRHAMRCPAKYLVPVQGDGARCLTELLGRDASIACTKELANSCAFCLLVCSTLTMSVMRNADGTQ